MARHFHGSPAVAAWARRPQTDLIIPRSRWSLGTTVAGPAPLSHGYCLANRLAVSRATSKRGCGCLMADLWNGQILMVIPSINGERLLARMLPTLRFKPSDVIVLDQGSNDDTAAVCANAGVELVQLGQPCSYTEACNIGAEIARAHGCKYVCVANNDIIFRTNVLAELWEEMERDPRLGIVAPSQIIIDVTLDQPALARRTSWHLEKVAFGHDIEPIDPAVARLEFGFLRANVRARTHVRHRGDRLPRQRVRLLF